MSAATLSRSRPRPRVAALDRDTASRLAEREYARFADQLASLSDGDWRRPTACPAWDVHALACHVLGMAEFAASPLEQARQSLAARRRGGLFIDALTGVQVDKHVHRSPADVAARVRAVGPRAARGRRRTPGPLRRVRMADQPVDETGSQTEDWALGYLVDVVLTRDTWMHRSDVAESTGREMELTAEHDGLLVADVVQEWASRHGRPCALRLTGPAGGEWELGTGASRQRLELDAVLFCRTLSGRAPGEGLLAVRVPF